MILKWISKKYGRRLLDGFIVTEGKSRANGIERLDVKNKVAHFLFRIVTVSFSRRI